MVAVILIGIILVALAIFAEPLMEILSKNGTSDSTSQEDGELKKLSYIYGTDVLESANISDAWITVPSSEIGVGMSDPWGYDIYWGVLNTPKVINQNSGPWDIEVHGEFNQIVIEVSRLSAIWYYNDFFSTIPQEVIDRYSSSYNVLNLPNTHSPKVEGDYLEPGSIPSISSSSTNIGVGNLLFGLTRISASKHYGGSIELNFEAHADVGVEIRNGDIAWDLDNLQLKMYVNPTVIGLNDPRSSAEHGNVICEFIPSSYTTYKINQNNELERIIEDYSEELNQAFSVLADNVLSDKIEGEARRFVNGFLRAKLWKQLTTDTKVIGINISDNYLDLATDGYEPAIQVKYRLTSIHTFTFDRDGIEINIECLFIGPSVDDSTRPRMDYSREYDFEIDKDQSYTSWENLGTYMFTDISNLQEDDITGDISFNIQAVDHDIFFDDHSSALIKWFQFNETGIKAEWEKDQTSRYLGSDCYEVFHGNSVLLFDESGIEKTMGFNLDISLYLTKR